MNFYRSDFSQLWITLCSNEELGVLDSSYLEDYFGADGQVTLLSTATGARRAVLMSEVTPAAVQHGVFKGYVPLSELPDGEYQVQCRVRDRAGNYTIIGAYQSPSGTERFSSVVFNVAQTGEISLRIGPAAIEGGIVRTLPPVNTTLRTSADTRPSLALSAQVAPKFRLRRAQTKFAVQPPSM